MVRNDRLQFGEFTLDLESGTLERAGEPVPLKPQPLELLGLLAESDGQLVTRDAIREALWADDTFVEYDSGINSCVRQIRRALGDDPAQPRFVQTVPRRGYRFLVPVERSSGAAVPERRLPSRQRPVLALGAVAVVAATLFLRSSPDELDRTLRLENPEQLTSAQGEEQVPSWSRDGRFLAYSTLHGSNWDVAVLQIASETPLNRTPDYGGDDLFPSWSPDGAQLAFNSARDGGGLYIMPALAGEARRVADVKLWSSAPCWSESGDQISYVTPSLQGPIYLETLDLRSGETSRVELPGRSLSRNNLACSADGALVAYADIEVHPFRAATTSPLLLMRLSDGEVFELAGEHTLNYSPSFSPDRRELYYVSNREGALDLWVQALDPSGAPTGEPRPLTQGVGVRSATVSPDGKRMAYARGRRVANVWRVPLLADRIASWGDAEQLTFDEAFIEAFDVDTKRRRIVLSSDRAGSMDLWVVPTDGGRPRQLTNEKTHEWIPSWSPDGERIFYYSNRAGSRDLWSLPADGGVPLQLTDDPRGEYYPVASPDGELLAYTANHEDTLRVWIRPIDGGDARPVGPVKTMAWNPVWSPDGRLLAFDSSEDAPGPAFQDFFLWMVPRDGGERKQIGSSPGRAPCWSMDGTRVYFVGRSETERAGDLWEVDLESGEERRLTDFGKRHGRLGNFALETDGRYLYYLWEDDVADLWVMDVVRGR